MPRKATADDESTGTLSYDAGLRKMSVRSFTESDSVARDLGRGVVGWSVHAGAKRSRAKRSPCAL
jgi:hypothetical protein